MIVAAPASASRPLIAFQVTPESAPYENLRDSQRIDVEKRIENLEEVFLASAKEHLSRLSQLGSNWNGEGAARPDPAAIDSARYILKLVLSNARNVGADWIEPLISPTYEGDVVMEWWKADRKLSLY